MIKIIEAMKLTKKHDNDDNWNTNDKYHHKDGYYRNDNHNWNHINDDYYWIDTQADLQADRALQSLQLLTPSVAKRIIVL